MNREKNFQEERNLGKSRSSKLAAFTMEKSRTKAQGISVMERENQSLPLYRKVWFWVLVVTALLIGIGIGIFFVVTASQKGHATSHYENDVNLDVTKLRVASVQAFSENNAQKNASLRSVELVSSNETSKKPKTEQSESLVTSESKTPKKNIRQIKTLQKQAQSQSNVPTTTPQIATQDKAPITQPSKQSAPLQAKKLLITEQKPTQTTKDTQISKPQTNLPIPSTYPNVQPKPQTHPQINTLPSPQQQRSQNSLPRQPTNNPSSQFETKVQSPKLSPQSFTITEKTVILGPNSQIKK